MTLQEYEHSSGLIRPMLLRTASAFLGKNRASEEAEDIVQETLITLWRMVSSGYEVRNLEGLAVKICKNTCVAHYRRRKVMKIQPFDGKDCIGGQAADTDVEKDDSDLLRKELFSHLNETQLQYIHLRNDEGLTLDEISSVCGRPKTSVKTTLSAARRQMLQLLKNEL